MFFSKNTAVPKSRPDTVHMIFIQYKIQKKIHKKKHFKFKTHNKDSGNFGVIWLPPTDIEQNKQTDFFF